jgi:hypothetical protein
MANIELDIVVRGYVTAGGRNEIVNTLKDCYQQFRHQLPYKIEVLITDSEPMMHDYMRQEKFKTGIIDDNLSDTICLYDTWKGFPRIAVSLENLRQYSKQGKPGLLRHQAAHSVLHGSLEYRIFRIPDDCRQIALIKGIEIDILEQAIQKLSVAVKDYETSRFLVDHNFINCQVAFVLEWIQSQQEMTTPAKQPKLDRQAKFIYQIGLLKPILLAHPLISVPKSKKIALEKQIRLGSKLEDILGVSLSSNEQNKLIQVSNLIAEGLTTDTHQNVDFALHQAISLA